ncbi:MAG: response regulator transcription factor [Lachnospiraceae bacterium]|nr:response regulator transcription factor [Lachnospiraceae bacterium]
MCAVGYSPVSSKLWIGSDEMLSLSEFEIYPRRRKVYIDGVELDLMAKEFDILCLLVINKGYVLTYSQIYEKIWGEDSIGDESNSVGCHIRSLRRKLSRRYPDAPFTIRCYRNIGYCLETDLK